jgi:glutathione S-transferase
MAGLKIYGIARSRTFRCLWLVEELGLAYEHVKVGFGPEGTRSPDFLRLNPNGHVPAIDDSGLVLWESLAINLYLAKKHRQLYPLALADEARTWQWSLWVMTEVERPFMQMLYHTRILPEAERDPRLAADGLQQLVAPIRVLDEHLAARPWLVGDGFSVADLNVASVLYTARAFNIPLPAAPHMQEWMDRCYARPAAIRAQRMRGD